MTVCDQENIVCHLGDCEQCQDVSINRLSLFENDDVLKPCTYLQWKDLAKVEVHGTLEDVSHELEAQMKQMRRHCFVAKTQLSQVKAMKSNLRDGEGILYRLIFPKIFKSNSRTKSWLHIG